MPDSMIGVGATNESDTDMVLREPHSYGEDEVRQFSQWRKSFDGGRLRVLEIKNRLLILPGVCNAPLSTVQRPEDMERQRSLG